MPVSVVAREAILLPEVFLDFSSCERRERKTSGYLGLESHFHADASCEIGTNGNLTITCLSAVLIRSDGEE